MKKGTLLCLFMTPWICARGYKEEINDHSINLTATYEFTSGSKIVFDLDQCSRLSFVLGPLGFFSTGLSKAIVLGKIAANLIMAKKEFERGETARGIEHLTLSPITLPNWYVLLSKSQKNDRLYLNRLSKCLAVPFIIGFPMYAISEYYLLDLF